MLRCYDSKRQNQEGWSSLHEHFGGKRRRFTTLNHKQKNLQRCCARDCAQTIFNLYKTAEGRLALGPIELRRSPPEPSRSRITLDSDGAKNMAPSDTLRNPSPLHCPDISPLIE